MRAGSDTDGSNATGRTPRVVISASLAYDLIMTFPGSFKDHILQDKAHVLSVSFLVDSLRKRRGGVAGNIAYNLALLGEPSRVVGAAGGDFVPYRAAFDALGIDTGSVLDVPDEFTASCFINSDLDGNQIVAFYPGALSHVDDVSIADLMTGADLGVVGATTPVAMRRHAEEIAAAGVRLVYDPSQQVVTLSAEDLAAGIELAWAMIGNDYELAMIGQKTGITIQNLVERIPFLAVTYGEKGSELFVEGNTYRIPAVPAKPLADPTGGGDAYRAGLLRGILLGVEPDVIGRIAALTATYAIEQHGTQEHAFTPEAFIARFDCSFPTFAGAVAGIRSQESGVRGSEVSTEH